MRKGQKCTKEMKERMKQAQAKRMAEGRHNFFKGHRLFGTSIGLIVKGKPSPKKGIPLSLETKAKLSASLRGQKRPEASRRLTGKKQSPELVAKRVASRKGYCHSEETKNKIGMANRTLIHKTDESKIWRNRTEYKQWRMKVFDRDNFTCKKCKTTGAILNPHHIRNFAEVVKLRFAVKNGITFCVKCHKKFHTRYGLKNNSLSQVNEFVNSIRC